ncbi:hypothetical protein LYNGBM3L_04090 [Moorena producens 3L]|uniref:Uncharacterized protein n=1 Tax=Moorena producens 3L TaxID=489825 RepID=F4XIX9_9CYAN|nr:hypothetical protein LYNGBM3L_04090 [Moorena producens 3L]
MLSTEIQFYLNKVVDEYELIQFLSKSLDLRGCLRSLICYIQAPVGPPILGDF